MRTLPDDLRYAARLLMRAPGFTLAALLTLALSTGLTTTIFSAVNAVLIRELPYPEPSRLVMLWGEDARRGQHRSQVCLPDVEDVARAADSLEGAAALGGYWSPVLSGIAGAEQLHGVRVSDGFFRVMKSRPMLGREFLPQEQLSGSDVAILSYELWARSFGHDAGIVGSKVTLSGKPYTVVGVMPRSFRALPVRLAEYRAEIYRPLGTEFGDEIRSGRHLRAIGRLKAGASESLAQQQVRAAALRLEQQYPDSNTGRGIRVVGLREEMVAEVRPSLLVLQGCVLLIVLIGCANVANLLLARSTTRRREMAVRQALGAGRMRLVRQLLTESALLAVAGGACGLLVAMWCAPMLERIGAGTIPELATLSIDWTVAGFAAAVSLATGLLFGMAPALEVSGVSPMEGMRDGRGAASGGSHRRRDALVVAETAVAVVLLVCAGLLMRSFAKLRAVDPGFVAGRTLVAELSLPGARYPDGDAREALLDRLLPELRRLPGVTTASVVTVLPESSNFNTMRLDVEGRVFERGAEPQPDQYEVTPEYFRTLSIPLRLGRLFTEQDDRRHEQVALINRTASERIWPGQNPLGQRIHTGGKDEPWRRVVGVVGDVYQYGLDSQKTPQVYVPYRQNRMPSMTLPVGGRGDETALVPMVRDTLRRIDREVPLAEVTTMQEVVSGSMAGRRFPMLLLAALGVCAVLRSDRSVRSDVLLGGAAYGGVRCPDGIGCTVGRCTCTAAG